MKTIDIIDLTIKILILFFLAATSQTSFNKRLWGIGVLSLAIWMTIFRMSFLRAAAIYAGVFAKENPIFVNEAKTLLQSSTFASVTDVVLLVGAVACFAIVSTHNRREKYGPESDRPL